MLALTNVPNSPVAVPNSPVAERAGVAPQSPPPGQQAPEWQRRVGDRGRTKLEEAGPGIRPCDRPSIKGRGKEGDRDLERGRDLAEEERRLGDREQERKGLG